MTVLYISGIQRWSVCSSADSKIKLALVTASGLAQLLMFTDILRPKTPLAVYKNNLFQEIISSSERSP